MKPFFKFCIFISSLKRNPLAKKSPYPSKAFISRNKKFCIVVLGEMAVAPAPAGTGTGGGDGDGVGVVIVVSMQPAIIDTCCTCAQRQNLPAGYLLWLSVWERAWGYAHCPRGWTRRGLGWSCQPGAATRVGRGRRTDEPKEMVEVKVEGRGITPHLASAVGLH